MSAQLTATKPSSQLQVVAPTSAHVTIATTAHKELRSIMSQNYDNLKRSWDSMTVTNQQEVHKREDAVAQLVETTTDLSTLKQQYQQLKKDSTQLVCRCKVCELPWAR